MRTREILLLILVTVLTGLSLWINFAPVEMIDNEARQFWLGRDVTTRLGLDLQGGTQVLLRTEEPPTEEQMEAVVGVINRRVNGLGVSESVVQQSGEDRIIVELPGVTNPEEAINILRGTGSLEFIDTQGQALPPGAVVRTSTHPNPAALLPTTPTDTATLTDTEPITDTEPVTDTATPAGDGQLPVEAEGPIYESITVGSDLDLTSVQPRFGAQQGSLNSPFGVSFAFRGESATRLAEFTRNNVGNPMCIVIDNEVTSCPRIDSPLLDGAGEITTNTQEDAERIFNQLKFGALPIGLVIESNSTVSASLGDDSVAASVVAGILGLIVVVLFMILYYRLPGVLATIALLIYTALVFAFYKLVPVTLTLPGIAGFILSIGVAVDANVLIFGRLKEELRHGKKLRVAVENGVKESWPAIRDSSVATLITSAILFLFGNSFGVSIIQGFALTLGIGILISLFTAVTITRTFLRLIVPFGFAHSPWMYGVEEAPGLELDRKKRGERGAVTA
ncbi:MAG: Preprotein translocase subunit SecD [Chloroflexi bacterium AL-W]|nr:Preprotein translocase subunit SecD [Chloroflexi bacterium AL-N1]NOK70591.1 Preprotein translocase subunit SecD [Chloroflexi bacterium AL-N10]NOK77583.1 Preprotein translocase subunit SecD [Chloroflexi bacterium AL-N5]NOK84434.1 Preprotein translocase subunit SecD [Chloroflexi bacterium AL-W]NOK92323.1 Preprotein translocase subunit SecD [Chloroflexi bacterium AL-N15]